MYRLVIYISLFPVFTHPFLTPFFPTLKISVPLCNTFPFSSPCSCVTPIGPPGGGGVSVFPSAPGGGGVPDFSEFPRIAPEFGVLGFLRNYMYLFISKIIASQGSRFCLYHTLIHLSQHFFSIDYIKALFSCHMTRE